MSDDSSRHAGEEKLESVSSAYRGLGLAWEIHGSCLFQQMQDRGYLVYAHVSHGSCYDVRRWMTPVRLDVGEQEFFDAALLNRYPLALGHDGPLISLNLEVAFQLGSQGYLTNPRQSVVSSLGSPPQQLRWLL